MDHTGLTIVSEGLLAVDGDIAGPVELRAKGTLAGNLCLKDTIVFEGALNFEGCRLMPMGANYGVITSKKSMTLPGDVYLEVRASIDAEQMATTGLGVSDRLDVEGDLTLKNTNYIRVHLQSAEAATYLLAQCTGTLTCDPSKLQTRGLEGINYDLKVEGNRLLLVVNDTRKALPDVAWTGAESQVWDYNTQNLAYAP